MKFLITAILSVLCAYPNGIAMALEFKNKFYLSQRVLLAEGKIIKGDAKALHEHLNNDPGIQEVHLVSVGGLLYEGVKIGKILRRHGMTTRVPTQGVCVSACVWALLGGTLRLVDHSAKVGVHMATMTNSKEFMARIKKALFDGKLSDSEVRLRSVISMIEKAAAKGAALKAQHLVKMGASLRLLAPGLDTNQWEIYWLSPDEIRSYNVANSD